MMRRRHFGAGRPLWWPENEAWPPIDPSHGYRVGRGRIFRRIVLLAVAMLTLIMFSTLTLAWAAATRAGIVPAHAAAPVVLLAGMFGAAAAGVVLVGVLRRVGMPLDTIMTAAERVAGGDYSVRVRDYGPPPVRALARAFNTMTATLESHDRQRRNLMADVAHELRTPLTVIQGRLEGLLDGVYPRDDRQVGDLLEEVHVLSRLVEDLRMLALSEAGALKLQKEPTEINALAGDVARTFAADAASRDITLTVHGSGDAAISLDPLRIREVLTNLLSNALRHTPAHGSVDVTVGRSTDGGVTVDVRDTGSGMTAEEIERAFDRFHKGPESRGSGLGLTIARSLVVAHGGEIHATSQPGRGTTMSFTLPPAS
jgi:two-component system OmpR family sensor kinase/two-component system sensor histidine kinase BaeS